jgi:diguanylate cyclase (GGDEF)-like protein
MALGLFYCLSAAFAFFVLRASHKKKHELDNDTQGLREEINVYSDENLKETKRNFALKEKIGRYNGLKNIIEEISRNLSLENTADNLCSLAFSLIGRKSGNCILYLVDDSGNLNIYKSKKETARLVIKEKQGDIFDAWVLRHSSPLLIEDIKKDFRFDLEKIKASDSRPVSSLISAPFISEHKFLGALRLDHDQPAFYTQDDLRFLVTLCDLGAVAIENAQLFQKTQELAIHDELTSLFSKAYFLERLKEECKRALRSQRPVSLLMLDIDYFKKYNDQFGHTAGDIVLRNLSLIISDSLKDLSSIASRFGGEEFCLLLPGLEKNKAVSLAESLRDKISKARVVLRRQETGITVSIGVAVFPGDAKDEEEIVLKADKALYKAKQAGRNRVAAA